MRRIHARRNCKLAHGIFVERHISSKMFRWNSAWAGEAHSSDVSEMPSANHPWTERAVFGHLKRNVAHDNHVWRVAVDVANLPAKSVDLGRRGASRARTTMKRPGAGSNGCGSTYPRKAGAGF
jgi:hypothetical protein